MSRIYQAFHRCQSLHRRDNHRMDHSDKSRNYRAFHLRQSLYRQDNYRMDHLGMSRMHQVFHLRQSLPQTRCTHCCSRMDRGHQDR